jgi:hypothetical protein
VIDRTINLPLPFDQLLLEPCADGYRIGADQSADIATRARRPWNLTVPDRISVPTGHLRRRFAASRSAKASAWLNFVAPPFVNTSVHFVNGFDYLYSADVASWAALD